ncbi:MAG: hypothetical protein ER33_12165 [Cyanobium sp. CACIAM 14]|nr:MAG: hypothetical protein ER33_12165 [Cyanobium sp. CACIAM 14]
MRRILRKVPDGSDHFLSEVSGVVHVGANTGQERDVYRSRGLCVVWIEPIPEVYRQLKANISKLSDQVALQALVAEVDGKNYEFHISNNNGESSSILDLKEHKDIWPDVDYTTTISLESITLSTLFKREQLDPSRYQALIMDTQGSELLVLQGSLPILRYFQYIKTEVSDFESYQGCCQLSDINAFMEKHGYQEIYREKFASRPEGGSYFNVVYKKRMRW